MSTWTDIDEPVLRAVADLPASMPPGVQWQLTIRPPEPSDELAGLDESQIDEALRRLRGAGLIDALERTETVAYAIWTRPRVTAVGSMVLGAWPDLDRMDAVEALQASLAALADREVDPERRGALRRAAGVVGSLSGSIVTKLIVGAAGQAGEAID